MGILRQYEERRRFNGNEPTGYGVMAGFHDVVGDDQISKMFKAVKTLNILSHSRLNEI